MKDIYARDAVINGFPEAKKSREYAQNDFHFTILFIIIFGSGNCFPKCKSLYWDRKKKYTYSHSLTKFHTRKLKKEIIQDNMPKVSSLIQGVK